MGREHDGGPPSGRTKTSGLMSQSINAMRSSGQISRSALLQRERERESRRHHHHHRLPAGGTGARASARAQQRGPAAHLMHARSLSLSHTQLQILPARSPLARAHDGKRQLDRGRMGPATRHALHRRLSTYLCIHITQNFSTNYCSPSAVRPTPVCRCIGELCT